MSAHVKHVPGSAGRPHGGGSTGSLYHQEGRDLVVEVSRLTSDDEIRVRYGNGLEARVPALALFPESGRPVPAPKSLVEISDEELRAHEDFYESLGPWVTGKSVEDHFRISRQRLGQWRLEGKILGVQFGDRRFYYPAHQFFQGRILPGLPPILHILSEHFEPETIASFLVANIEGEAARTYWDVMREGEADLVDWAHRLVASYAT